MVERGPDGGLALSDTFLAPLRSWAHRGSLWLHGALPLQMTNALTQSIICLSYICSSYRKTLNQANFSPNQTEYMLIRGGTDVPPLPLPLPPPPPPPPPAPPYHYN
jgi:hypothetical protein